MYLTPSSAPPTAPTSSASDIPPSAPVTSPPSTAGFPTLPSGPQRVHSAPAHILNMSNGVSEAEHEGASAMDESSGPNPFPLAGREWDGALGASAISGQQAGEWEMEQSHSRQSTHVKQEDQTPGFFDESTFGYPQGTTAYVQQQQQAAQSSQQAGHGPSASFGSIQLVDVASAIALLRNRLPIMEAALSTTPNAPGGDEEEIWKGVEAAYGELRRIMMGRKDVRRGLSRSGTIKAGANVRLARSFQP